MAWPNVMSVDALELVSLRKLTAYVPELFEIRCIDPLGVLAAEADKAPLSSELLKLVGQLAFFLQRKE